MSLSLIPLLMVHEAVPESARRALREVSRADEPLRLQRRIDAARTLVAETGLSCADAKELVAL